MARSRCARRARREVYFVFSMIDMPGQPFVVVPLVEGADAAQISRLFQGGGKAPRLCGFRVYRATLHNAVIAGTPAALERVRPRSGRARGPSSPPPLRQPMARASPPGS